MAISSFMGLQTALSGLMANQEALETTSNNIANANTPGYTRQLVGTVERSPLQLPSGAGGGVELGSGVDVDAVTRARDDFLDVSFRAQNSVASGTSQEASTLGQVQSALNEPSSSGISSQLNKFWSDWNDVANDPTSPAAKQTLVDDATTLSQSFNALDGQMAAIQTQAASNYTTLTGPGGKVLSDAQQIAQLNASISQELAGGTQPNDLLDQRDKLIDDLSSLAKVSVSPSAQMSGAVDVSFGDAATPLVSGTTVNWPQTLTAAAGGQLGTLLNLSGSSGQIATYRSTLGNVASQLISEVNTLHTSTPFFSGSDAATIAVAVTPSQVQTSSTGTAGGNDTALAIANLRGGAADQDYAAFVSQVGSDVAAANSRQTTSAALLTSAANQRASVTSVSLDEEMTNLVTFQRGYQASARVMSAMDDMLNTLVNQVGAGV